MEEKVRVFNRLARPQFLPTTGRPNHLTFGVCHVDLNPPADFLFIVHPQNRYLQATDEAPFILAASGPEKADSKDVIGYLLEPFTVVHPTAPPSIAPWNWSALEPKLAQAVEEGLRKLGVRSDLCQVGVCSPEERTILEKARADYFDHIVRKLKESGTSTLPKTVDLGD